MDGAGRPSGRGSVSSGIDDFVGRLVASGVARPEELEGCTADEVAVFERDFGLKLPRTYRQFLARMGYAAGKLFAWDHVDTSYLVVLSMLDALRAPRDEPADSPDEDTYLRTVKLPDNALVILGRLDEQFHLIECDGGDDAPVFYLSEEGNPPERIYGSVLDWLEDWRRGAEEAIRVGYFKGK
jgi:hypothetical protein